MLDRERIKQRIRKLLNLGADASAAEGEIENALRMAAELLDAHHLDRAEIEASAPSDAPKPDVMNTADAALRGARYSTWESTLANAIVKIIGSIKHYRTHDNVPSGIFAKVEYRPIYRFYGPEEDCITAAEMFGEWSNVIATLAIGKYGGLFRGDGAMYAYGFASSLYNKARDIERARSAVVTPSTQAIVKAEGGTLAQVLARKQEKASAWLETAKGVKLVSSIRRTGYRAGDYSALEAGRDDGSRADFSASRRAKLSS